MAKAIDPKALQKKLTNEEPLVLLDVRRKADYEADPEKIPGAVWRDPEKVETWINELPFERPVAVYCVKGGAVSQSVADHLQQKGLEAVFLEGGLKGWRENRQSVADAQVSRHHYTIQPADLNLLRQAGVSEADITHCLKVAEKALEIADRTGVELNLELIGRGALFHDLGKAKTHDLDHGRIGAEMGRGLGLPESLTTVMEKHIRGGMSQEEAKELGLPIKDYSLNTLEEKIIIYADRLVDIITDGIVTLNSEAEAEERFMEILENIPKYGKNENTLKRYLGYHQEIQDLIKRSLNKEDPGGV
jgi:uncharacterized protein